MKLNAKRYSEQGEPLILMHGLFGSYGNLGWQARELAKQFAVVSLDLRNHGGSPHSDQMDYPSMAADVIEYMDDKGLDACHLLGHSMGGKVAMQIALLAPQRVLSLIVADIAPVTYQKSEHEEIFRGLNALDLASLSSRKDADLALEAYEPNEMVRQFLLTNLVKDKTTGFAWRINLHALEANYDALRAKPVGDTPFVGRVLFIKGADSAYIKEEYRDEILALFPNASVKVIMQTGHWLHAEKPQTFFRIANDFLQNT
ncbi:MAG: alpha/beta fold hydrolase [Pseudohongiellaceae bacterium]|nr:alpha/beta fold hydrolase [Pseudohongiellaceae bacterium]